MSKISIREATITDAQLIFDFIVELAVYEKAREEVKTDVKGIIASLFSTAPKAFALICEVDSVPVGYAVYFFNYSTWLGKYGIYLEDLYISPGARGKGAGKACLQYISALAEEKGCARFEWSVLDWNTPAIDFYKSLGAKPQDEWITYRTSVEELNKLAKGSKDSE